MSSRFLSHIEIKSEKSNYIFSINILDVQIIIQKLSKSFSQTLRERKEAAATLLTTAHC